MKSFKTHLNELSKKTLGSYINKAVSPTYPGGMTDLTLKGAYRNDVKAIEKSVTRSKYVRKAVKKLADVDRLNNEEVVAETNYATCPSSDPGCNKTDLMSTGRMASKFKRAIRFDQKKKKKFRDAAVTGNPRDFANEEVVNEKIGHVKKGAFHAWLGKSPDEPITAADIRKGLAAGGHAAKMAEFAKNIAHVGEEVVNEVSKKTLSNYVSGAMLDYGTHARKGMAAALLKKSDAEHDKKIEKRIRGVAHALTRLSNQYGLNDRLRKKAVKEEAVNENFADWHEKMSKGSREGNEVQFKIKNAGGRTEAYKNGKKLGWYDHSKRQGYMSEETVVEDYNQTNNLPDFLLNTPAHYHTIEKPAYLDKNRKRDTRRAFKKKYEAKRNERDEMEFR